MTLLPPSTETEQPPLKLETPEPPQPVQEDNAQTMLPAVPEDRKLAIGQQANGFVKDLATFNPNSPEFGEKLNDIRNLASSELVKASEGPNRILQSRVTSIAGSKRYGGDATQHVAQTLGELRMQIDDLTPNQANLSAGQKLLSFLPGGKKIKSYFQRYESAQSQLDAIMKALLSGEEELRKDNASLEQERRQLWDVMQSLNEYIILAEQIDKDLVSEIEQLKNAGNTQGASVLESDMLFTVRQRRQDLMTQLAVSIQSYLSMDLIKKNNIELIKGVDRARTTTLTALRTAVITAQALTNQKLVLQQIDGLNETTNNLIQQNAVLLHQQTVEINKQAVNSGVTLETLQKAFGEINATMDEIDRFRQEANTTMGNNIAALGTELEKARPMLERARAQEAIEAGKSA